MPNWCFTDIKMTGEKEKVQFLHDKIEEWTSKNYMQNGFGNTWLGNIVLGSGIATEEDIDKHDAPRCRGSIVYTDIDLFDTNNAELTVQTETAWNPMMKMWSMINEQYDRAKNILSEHKEGHNELAELLVQREVIFADDVEKIFGKRPWVSRSEELLEAQQKAEAEAMAEKRAKELEAEGTSLEAKVKEDKEREDRSEE